jgi:hypothetical protein
MSTGLYLHHHTSVFYRYLTRLAYLRAVPVGDGQGHAAGGPLVPRGGRAGLAGVFFTLSVHRDVAPCTSQVRR